METMLELDHPKRKLDIPSAQNVRDLGGYATSDGRQTQWGRFVRAGDMDQLTAEDQQKLIDHGINTVIDLRMVKEVTQMPNVFTNSSQVRFHIHDFWGDRFRDYRSTSRGAPPEVKLADLYCAGLVQSGFVMADIMTTIADSEDHGFAYHCRSGKDRTGLVSAMLLAIAGVPEETICADYALTEKFLRKPDSDKRVKPGQPGYFLTGCSPETMALTLAFITQEYGGVEDYLAQLGVDADQISRVKSKLLD
jgi:protein-tyrosine phosphatase|tara:strand:+ start:552 stop:1301 length:750 start_codon:yes stop_codon:yes gene_type:complete